MFSHLDRQEKDDILKDIAALPIVLKEVAHAQSRLSRGNGKRHDGDESES
jgi:hypothetical protein